MPYNSQSAMPNSAFRPFTPRIIRTGYIAPAAGPKVFLTAPDAGSGESGPYCGPDYPYDPRNLALVNVWWNQSATYLYSCPGKPVYSVNIPEYTFYSTVSQQDADNIACEAAAGKAQADGWTCAVCNLGVTYLITENGSQLLTENGNLLILG